MRRDECALRAFIIRLIDVFFAAAFAMFSQPFFGAADARADVAELSPTPLMPCLRYAARFSRFFAMPMFFQIFSLLMLPCRARRCRRFSAAAAVAIDTILRRVAFDAMLPITMSLLIAVPRCCYAAAATLRLPPLCRFAAARYARAEIR